MDRGWLLFTARNMGGPLVAIQSSSCCKDYLPWCFANSSGVNLPAFT
jgi:hypothetical protein